jgi:hypothetical protein
MNSITTQFGTFSISETVHIEQWSGMNQRSWHVLRKGELVAHLTFILSDLAVRVSFLKVEDNSLFDDIGRELLLLVQSHYPGQWLEIPPQASGAAKGIASAKRINEDRQTAELILKKFDDRMVEAEKVFEHMTTHNWGYSGRMEFYGKFPEFFRQEESRERLIAKLEALPDYLVRVSRPIESQAKSS